MVKSDEFGPIPGYDWQKVTVVAFVHAVAFFGIGCWCLGVESVTGTWRSGLLGLMWFILTSTAITAGYHRYFSHRSHRARGILEWYYLLFGAGAFQGSAISWPALHRAHHTFVDNSGDPYNAKRGFMWAHLGWVLRKTYPDEAMVKDLVKNPRVAWQNKWDLPLEITMTFIVPMIIGGLMFDEWLGGLMTAGFIKLLIQWHMTFSVNSIAHFFGEQEYSTENPSRSSFIVSLLTWGEGNNHNRHHDQPYDYRTGIEWWAFDPAKWSIWTCSKIGLASNLRISRKLPNKKAM